MYRVIALALSLTLSCAVPAVMARTGPAYDNDAVCSMVATAMSNRTAKGDDSLRAWDSASGYFMAMLIARYPDDAQLKTAMAAGAKQMGGDLTPWISSCLQKYLDGSKRFRSALAGAGGL